MRHEGGYIAGMCRHERERRHSAPTAGEHLDRADPERLDDGVHIIGLDGGRVVDAAVLAGAATEAARVIGDHGAIREMRGQGGEAAGLHGLSDHEQRRASVGAGWRSVDVVGDVDLGRLEHVCGCHAGFDLSFVKKSSHPTL